MGIFNRKKVKKLEEEIYSLNNEIEGYIKNEYLLGLIEFEDGHLEEVPVNNIIFDDNKIEEYYFKEREEK